MTLLGCIVERPTTPRPTPPPESRLRDGNRKPSHPHRAGGRKKIEAKVNGGSRIRSKTERIEMPDFALDELAKNHENWVAGLKTAEEYAADPQACLEAGRVFGIGGTVWVKDYSDDPNQPHYPVEDINDFAAIVDEGLENIEPLTQVALDALITEWDSMIGLPTLDYDDRIDEICTILVKHGYCLMCEAFCSTQNIE